MRGRDIDRHAGLHRQPDGANIRRITVSRFGEANLRALLLQQIDHVLLLANQTFEFRMGKARIKLLHHLFQHIRVEGIGKDKRQTRLRLRRERHRQLIQPRAGGENSLHVAQHLFPLGR